MIALLVGLIAWLISVDVPSVVGLPIEAAKTILTSKQLNYRIAESDQATTGVASRVIQQQPPAGTGATKGSSVELLITKGALTGALPSPPSAAQDAEFQKAIVGKWRTIRMSNGFPIDQQGTYLPNGRANWKGEANLYILRTSYGIRGTWRVKDGRLEIKVETSSVPNIIPTGHTGHVEIIGVTAEEFAYFDPTDDGTYVDLRVK